MRRSVFLALPLALIACGSQLLGTGFTAVAQTPAQTPASAQTPAPTTAPCPPTATLDQLIVALDDAVSGPANKDRTCMKQLLLPTARLIPIQAVYDGQSWHVLEILWQAENAADQIPAQYLP